MSPSPIVKPTPRAGLEWVWWLSPLLVALALRLWLGQRTSGFTMDSPLYVMMAESLARGEHALLGPAHHGYPALIALAALVVPGREDPGLAVARLAGLAIIPMVYALARRGAPPAWALLAALLVAIHPLPAIYSEAIMTETSFLAMTCVALLLLESRRFGSAGLVLGLGYAVRPEALVVTAGAALLGRGRLARTARLIACFTLVAGAYVGFLSWSAGRWTLTPKEALVGARLVDGMETEFHLSDVPAPSRGLDRGRQVATQMLRDYLPGLGRHARQLVEVWPWPLLAVSLVGLVHRRGPLLTPFLWLLVIPLLGVMPYPRFCLILVPSLAVYFADGASWIAERSRAWNRFAMPAVTASAVALALAGLAVCWWGPHGKRALNFEDGPIVAMRQAGLWLLEHGRPGARVLDRKPYVPYFAHMEHVRMPDDDYDTLINWARASHVDYIVLEEYITASIRRQFLPLVTDEAFERRERRLRPIHKVRPYNWGGVAIYEVVRETGR